MQITSPLPVRSDHAQGSATVFVGTVTVTITKNQPSPADDTSTRHAETGPSFMGITNEDHIGKISDG